MPRPRRAGRVRRSLSRVRRARSLLRGGALGLVAAASALTLGVTDAAAAVAYVPTHADQRILTELSARFGGAGLGGSAGGEVLDAASGHVDWARNPGGRLMPASSAKLATAVAALTVLGPGHTERTRAMLAGSRLYLVGGGDQHLTSRDLGALATATATALKAQHRTTVTLYVDDSLFPAPVAAPGWLTDYQPGQVAPVRALALLGARVPDTALAAGTLFARQLAAAGVHASAPRRATTASGARLLASRASASLATEIEYMLKQSDNNNAEGFARLTALALGRRADWTGATGAVRSVVARYGVPLGGVVMYDASGLSRWDRMTAAALASLAGLSVDARYHALLWPVLPGLPVAGRDGTLSAAEGRFTTWPSSCAAGKVFAKTGTLHDVVALAGVTRGTDGRWKSFAFLENGAASLSAARNGVDGLAATVEGCW